ncbi:hypothetical protein [Pseudogracilibacillus auburnensis]|nr:hypothetical protein [Pseudogracilibacillus auburnensis]MBO1003933.1 hypothetical protein [Pseudogracilibacillus auburnensis]
MRRRLSRLIRFAIKAGPVVYPIARTLLQKRKKRNDYNKMNGKRPSLRT